MNDSSLRSFNASQCANCGQVRVIETPKGSVFYLCKRSEFDHLFPKYPPQPVLGCSGWQPTSGSADRD